MFQPSHRTAREHLCSLLIIFLFAVSPVASESPFAKPDVGELPLWPEHRGSALITATSTSGTPAL